MARTFLVYRGFDRGLKALLYRASHINAAKAAAKGRCNPACPTVTVRDVLGGLRAEYHYNEATGETRSQVTPTGGT
jgi:hypothetical protein